MATMELQPTTIHNLASIDVDARCLCGAPISVHFQLNGVSLDAETLVTELVGSIVRGLSLHDAQAHNGDTQE